MSHSSLRLLLFPPTPLSPLSLSEEERRSGSLFLFTMISVQDQPVAGSSPELQRSLHEILGGGIRKSHFAPGILDSSSSSIGSVLTSRSSNLCVDILLVHAFSRRNPTLIWFILNGSGVTVHCMGQSYLLRSSVGIDRNPKRNYKVSDAAPVCRSPFNISN